MGSAPWPDNEDLRRFLVGLIGAGIQASRTPAMHEREAKEQGLGYEYRLLDIDRMPPAGRDLEALIAGAERQGFAGLNITHPFKQAVIPLLTALSDEARLTGAVNTVVLRDGRRTGHNTDTTAFRESFRTALRGCTAQPAVQLGAGGAGAATAHAVLSLGLPHLTIFDPEPQRLGGLLASLEARFGPGRAAAGTDVAGALTQAGGLIHATPVGMAKYPGMALAKELLRPALWVAEVVYMPLETELLREARRIGCRTMDGGGMAVLQAAEAFERFTGTPADAARMARHFREMTA